MLTTELRARRAMIALVIVVAIAPFLQSLAYGYVLDDTYAISGNVGLAGWGSLGRVWTEQFGGGGASPFAGLYRPLTMTLFALVFNAGAKWPLWFHLVAVVAHATAALVVWRLLERGTSRWPALLGALWFAAHPVHVEAVANITNVSEVLVAIFTCLLAIRLVRIAEYDQAAGWRDALVVALLYLAALLSKESGAMAAPVAAICAWGWRAASAPATWRPDAASIRRWWPVAASWVAAVAFVATLRANVLGGPLAGGQIAAIAIADMSAMERVASMLALGPKMLELLFWPRALNPHYGPSTFPSGGVGLLSAATVLAVAAAAYAAIRAAARGDRRWLVGLAWTLLAFLPASNLLVATGQVLAERTLYVPSIGVSMVLATLLHRLAVAASTPTSEELAKRAWPAAAIGVAVIVVVFSLHSLRGTRAWRGHGPLFAQMIAADADNYAGYWFAAIEASRQGHDAESLGLLERAYALYQKDRGVILDLGAALTRQGHFLRAAEVYQQGLRLSPNDSAIIERVAALPKAR